MVAVVFTVGAFVLQAGYASGLIQGSVHPALRGSPMPLLLVAAPAWALAAAWAVPPRRLRTAVSRLARVPVWVGILVVLSGTVALWASMQGAVPYLGHDEAVYGLKARSWLNGAPASSWAPYRPLGLSALGWVALSVNDSVGALRLVGLTLALASLGVAYLVASRLTSPRRAVVAIAVFASGWGFLRRLPEFLNDIAAAGLLLAVAYVIHRSRERPGRYDLAAAAVLGVLAFHLRYGAASGLLALAVAGLLTWGPRAWLSSWRQVAGATAIFAAGLLPHLLYSQRTAGSPLAIISSAGEVAGRAYPGDGLVYYALVFPFRLAGDLGGVVMTAGLVAAALALWRRRRGAPTRRRDQVRVFFGLTAVIHVVVLGLTAHGEERFVFFPVLLLTILGVDAIADVARSASRVVLATLVAFAVVGAAANAAVVRDGYLSLVTAERTSLVAAAEMVDRQHPAGRACLVANAYQPELGWYTGCATMPINRIEQTRPVAGRSTYVLLFADGRDQPSEATLQRLLRGRSLTTVTLETGGSLGVARLITLD